MKIKCCAVLQSPVWCARWSLTGVLAGTSITEMCILLICAFRLPSFLKAQLQSMHGNRGASFDCGRKRKNMPCILSACIFFWLSSDFLLLKLCRVNRPEQRSARSKVCVESENCWRKVSKKVWWAFKRFVKREKEKSTKQLWDHQ